ncbi:MAG TPA: hypothetical protein VNS09_04010 [Solirubrobacter sp.]|nr:hypothetical protein [Solirubrobacter sp.]
MSAAPQAALGVAIALLVLAACARGAILADVRDQPARRLAERYLEPLGNWCAIAVVVYLLAVTAAGEVNVPRIGLGVALGVLLAATLLWPERDAEPAAAAPADPDPARPAPPPVRETAGTLWSRPAGR